MRYPVALFKLLKHIQRYVEALQVLASQPLNAKKNCAILQLQNNFGFYGIIDKIENIDESLNATEQASIDIDTRMKLSAFYVINEDYENTFVELTKILTTDRNCNEGYARKSMVKIFELLGNQDVLLKQYRPILSIQTN